MIFFCNILCFKTRFANASSDIIANVYGKQPSEKAKVTQTNSDSSDTNSFCGNPSKLKPVSNKW